MRMETAYQLEWHGYLVTNRKDVIPRNPGVHLDSNAAESVTEITI